MWKSIIDLSQRIRRNDLLKPESAWRAYHLIKFQVYRRNHWHHRIQESEIIILYAWIIFFYCWQGDIATCAGTWLHVWSINGDVLGSVDTCVGRADRMQQILCVVFSQTREWDSLNVIITGSTDGVVRVSPYLVESIFHHWNWFSNGYIIFIIGADSVMDI